MTTIAIEKPKKTRKAILRLNPIRPVPSGSKQSCEQVRNPVKPNLVVPAAAQSSGSVEAKEWLKPGIILPDRTAQHKSGEASAPVEPRPDLPTGPTTQDSAEAIEALNPRLRMPSRIPNQTSAEANHLVKPAVALPGGPDYIPHSTKGIADRADTVLRIVAMFREWKSLVSMATPISNRRLAYARDVLGFGANAARRASINEAKRGGVPKADISKMEAEYKASRVQCRKDAQQILTIIDRNTAIATGIKKGKPKAIPERLQTAATVLDEYARNTYLTMHMLTAPRDQRIEEMKRLAATLPGASIAQGQIRGFGLNGFAKIVAETGDLSNYSNPGKVWKRFALHVYNGRALSTWRKKLGKDKKTLTAEQWGEAGNSCHRTATIRSIGDPMLMAGGMRDIYKARRAAKEGCFETKGHSDNDARRYVCKRLLREVWKAWNRESAAIDVV